MSALASTTEPSCRGRDEIVVQLAPQRGHRPELVLECLDLLVPYRLVLDDRAAGGVEGGTGRRLQFGHASGGVVTELAEQGPHGVVEVLGEADLDLVDVLAVPLLHAVPLGVELL